MISSFVKTFENQEDSPNIHNCTRNENEDVTLFQTKELDLEECNSQRQQYGSAYISMADVLRKDSDPSSSEETVNTSLAWAWSLGSGNENDDNENSETEKEKFFQKNTKKEEFAIKNYSSINFQQFLHPKLALSLFIWSVTYIFMGVFGGSVAFYHFPRVFPESYEPVPLPDFGYDLIPYFCPLWNNGHSNLQSVILLFFYMIVFAGALRHQGNKGRIIVQQLLHLNTLIFLARTTTVGVTGLPQPNPRCRKFDFFFSFLLFFYLSLS